MLLDIRNTAGGMGHSSRRCCPSSISTSYTHIHDMLIWIKLVLSCTLPPQYLYPPKIYTPLALLGVLPKSIPWGIHFGGGSLMQSRTQSNEIPIQNQTARHNCAAWNGTALWGGSCGAGVSTGHSGTNQHLRERPVSTSGNGHNSSSTMGTVAEHAWNTVRPTPETTFSLHGVHALQAPTIVVSLERRVLTPTQQRGVGAVAASQICRCIFGCGKSQFLHRPQVPLSVREGPISQ